MNLTNLQTYDMSPHGANTKVHSLLINVNNIQKRASEMIDMLNTGSWLEKLDPVAKFSYEARAEKTIDKLVKSILSEIKNEVTEEFGEYLVSVSAQDALELAFSHIKIPLAEMLKEKIMGNPGFDFHTETSENLLAFGEAKYSGSVNPYKESLEQIRRFINEKKDNAELVDLQNFISKITVTNALSHKNAYVAAFSINSNKPEKIIENAFNSKYLKDILDQEEVYLIGVKVDDQ